MTLPQLIRVKKYPNRRLYDATRSQHLTHEELYDLVIAGHTVSVIDSRSGSDITNLVLIQALLERSPEKLSAFPPEISHLLVRASEQVLRSAAHGWLTQLMRSIAPMATTPLGFAPPFWPAAQSPAASSDSDTAPARAEHDMADRSEPARRSVPAPDLDQRLDDLLREVEALRRDARHERDTGTPPQGSAPAAPSGRRSGKAPTKPAARRTKA